MVIAIESLLFLLAGIVLAFVLARVFSRPPAPDPDPSRTPLVKLIRAPRTLEGREETRLLLNDQVILTASNDGVRLAEYADEVEQLEAMAARLAAALGVGVEFERVTPKAGGREEFMVRDLPRISEDELQTEGRRRRLHRQEDEA